MNDERNVYNNVTFLQHLKGTHTTDRPPSHTCIIKADISCGGDSNQTISRSMYNRLLDECGDSDVTNGNKFFCGYSIKVLLQHTFGDE